MAKNLSCCAIGPQLFPAQQPMSTPLIASLGKAKGHTAEFGLEELEFRALLKCPLYVQEGDEKVKSFVSRRVPVLINHHTLLRCGVMNSAKSYTSNGTRYI